VNNELFELRVTAGVDEVSREPVVVVGVSVRRGRSAVFELKAHEVVQFIDQLEESLASAQRQADTSSPGE
jgi:hypothetical protein